MQNQILIAQFSDIHCNLKKNPILNKKDKLFDAIKNEIGSSIHVFIVLTGDIANTGTKEEFEIAYDFLMDLKQKLHDYCPKCEIHFIFTPGNHDCDFSQDQTVRELVIGNITKSPETLNPALLKTCVDVQQNYFEFIKKFDSNAFINQTLSNDLFSRYEFKIANKQIAFNSFNLSWVSCIKEQ